MWDRNRGDKRHLSLRQSKRGRAEFKAKHRVERVLMESLERRDMLTAAPVLINFQPSSSEQVANYAADSGLAYDARDNGMVYGWDAENGSAVDRNSTLSLDQRYDTNLKTQGDRSYQWELGLPTGVYNVRLVAGDPLVTSDAVYAFNVEGTSAMNKAPTSTAPWVTADVTRGVSDGRLTLANGATAANNAIDFVEVTDASPTNLVAKGDLGAVYLTWKSNSKQATQFRIERSTNGTTFSTIATVGLGVTRYSDIGRAYGTRYYYRVRALASGALSDYTEASAMPIFSMYEHLLFTNQPDYQATYKMKAAYVTDREMFANGDTSVGNEAATRALARKIASLNQVLVLDIEHWPVDIRYSSTAEVSESITKMVQIIDWIHKERPTVKVGYYGVLPIRDYWTPYNYYTALALKSTSAWWAGNLTKFTNEYKAWQAANNYLKPIAAKVDIVFPSLYTFYDDTVGWSRYAKGNLSEARRYVKPVLPFLWPQYHDSGELNGQYIPGTYWKMQLDTCKKQADSVLLWGGWGVDWNESLPWWTATKQFMSTL